MSCQLKNFVLHDCDCPPMELCGRVIESARSAGIPYVARRAEFRLYGAQSRLGQVGEFITYDCVRWRIVEMDSRPCSEFSILTAVHLRPEAVKPLGEQVRCNVFQSLDMFGYNPRTEQIKQFGPIEAVLSVTDSSTEDTEDLRVASQSYAMFVEREYAIKLRENWHLHDGVNRWKVLTVTNLDSVTSLPRLSVAKSKEPQQ